MDSAARPDTTPRPAPPLEEARVLVVDDEPDILETIEDLLEDQVGAFLEAKSFEQAGTVLSTGDVDLAVLDLMGVRGIDLVRAFAPKLPCIVITGQTLRPVTVEWMREVGVRAYLPKTLITDLPRCARMVLETPDSMHLWELWLAARQRARADGRF